VDGGADNHGCFNLQNESFTSAYASVKACLSPKGTNKTWWFENRTLQRESSNKGLWKSAQRENSSCCTV